MEHSWVAVALWSALLASTLLTVAGFALRSWPAFLAAAVLSAGFSVAAGFSVGPLTFLVTCLQLAAALQLRWPSRLRRPFVAPLGATLLWVLIVPVQVAGVHWLPWLVAFPLVTLVAMALALVGPRSPAAGGGPPSS